MKVIYGHLHLLNGYILINYVFRSPSICLLLWSLPPLPSPSSPSYSCHLSILLIFHSYRTLTILPAPIRRNHSWLSNPPRCSCHLSVFLSPRLPNFRFYLWILLLAACHSFHILSLALLASLNFLLRLPSTLLYNHPTAYHSHLRSPFIRS